MVLTVYFVFLHVNFPPNHRFSTFYEITMTDKNSQSRRGAYVAGYVRTHLESISGIPVIRDNDKTGMTKMTPRPQSENLVGNIREVVNPTLSKTGDDGDFGSIVRVINMIPGTLIFGPVKRPSPSNARKYPAWSF